MLPHSLIILLTAALATPVTTRSPEQQTPLEAPPPTKFPWIQRFASIGDSYSAGLGAGPRLDFYCSRYALSHPHLLHTSLLGPNPHRTHQFLSCSGQTSTEILTTQLPALTSPLDLLTISAGGNDIGLGALLNACIYQFYPSASPSACPSALSLAASHLSSGALLANLTSLVRAALPKMHPAHGAIYLTGYATFFATADPACDAVSWAVWSGLAPSAGKQFLRKDLRHALNELVGGVNGVLREVAAEAGPRVRFVDYDEEIKRRRGRFCEEGVREPAPGRGETAFYEWGTVDGGEEREEVLGRTGEDVPRGSFEGGIAREVGRAVGERPGWEWEGGMGFVNRTKAGEVEGEGILGDTVHWLLPDGWKRVFHLRPEGHRVVARMVVADLKRRERHGDGDGEVGITEL